MSDTDVALTRLEAEWNTAHMQGDATTLGRLFADDLVVVVPGMRPLSKADSLGMFKVGGMKFDRYESSDIQSRVYGETAIVTGRIKRTRTIGGKTMVRLIRFRELLPRGGYDGTHGIKQRQSASARPFSEEFRAVAVR